MPKLVATAMLFCLPALVHADAFDLYTNLILDKIPHSAAAKKVTLLTPEMMVDHARALPGLTATFVVVRTNEGRLAKLLVQAARQKVSADNSLPILLVERYVTFREGEERTIHAQGQNLCLFHDFRLSLDLGQVVPGSVPADLRFHADEGKIHVEPIGKAELYLVTKHVPEANPKKTTEPVVGSVFQPEYFNGVFKLYDDGRRSGTLQLSVGADSEVTGAYYSDKDGQKYEVTGKVEQAHNKIQFKVVYPRTLQFFQGWMFTADARVITGFSRLQERELGFYAVRETKKK